jgi:hypothetical protein
MALQTMIDPNQNYADDLREFTTAFFDYFGAQIDAVDSQPGLLSVSMDGALADHCVSINPRKTVAS